MDRAVNYINGEWIVSATGRYLPITNPATGEVLGEVVQSDETDVELAVRAASEAQRKWRLVPAPKRAEVLSTQAPVPQPMERLHLTDSQACPRRRCCCLLQLRISRCRTRQSVQPSPARIFGSV